MPPARFAATLRSRRSAADERTRRPQVKRSPERVLNEMRTRAVERRSIRCLNLGVPRLDSGWLLDGQG